MTTPRHPRRHKNTIRDVAAAAGVSIGTVSKALSGGGRMREETREKIRAAAERLGFRPNDLAQSLHRNQSSTIGIISNDRFGRFAFPIVEAMEELFAERGIAIFMCNATDDPSREQKHIDQLIGKRVDGIAVTARRADFRPKITLPGTGVPDMTGELLRRGSTSTRSSSPRSTGSALVSCTSGRAGRARSRC